MIAILYWDVIFMVSKRKSKKKKTERPEAKQSTTPHKPVLAILPKQTKISRKR